MGKFNGSLLREYRKVFWTSNGLLWQRKDSSTRMSGTGYHEGPSIAGSHCCRGAFRLRYDARLDLSKEEAVLPRKGPISSLPVVREIFKGRYFVPDASEIHL